jgi:hypothetical protein
MGIVRKYKPKAKNEEKLNNFVEKLERQGLFKEEVIDGKKTNNNTFS